MGADHGQQRVTEGAVNGATSTFIDVDVAGGMPHLAEVEARVGALDGTVHTQPTPDGVRIRMEIPCE